MPCNARKISEAYFAVFRSGQNMFVVDFHLAKKKVAIRSITEVMQISCLSLFDLVIKRSI